jgi:hypothetical protein
MMVELHDEFKDGEILVRSCCPQPQLEALATPDRGLKAWMVLIGAFVFEALLWVSALSIEHLSILANN